MRGGAADTCHDQEIRPFGQCRQARFVLPGILGFRAAVVVADIHVETCAPACDGGSDAAQAQYAQTLAADPRAKRKRAVVCAAPAALADIALGLTDASRR